MGFSQGDFLQSQSRKSGIKRKLYLVKLIVSFERSHVPNKRKLFAKKCSC